MRRVAWTLLIGLALGGVAGFALGIFAYPYIFLSDIVSNEQAPDPTRHTLVAKGLFAHANPSDPIHWGKGDVTVYGDVIRLEENFEVGPGPKFHLYLVPETVITPNTPIHKTMFVDLGRLRSFKGSQNFAVPPGLDLRRYPYLVVWCEQFNVLISPAKLQHNM
jgi:hypothetical protein